MPAVNEAIVSAMGSIPNGTVLDWDRLVPLDALSSDGVHPDAGQQDVLASILAPFLQTWRDAVLRRGADRLRVGDPRRRLIASARVASPPWRRGRIGSLEVSVVGLGCNNFGRRVDEDGTRRVVDASLDAGVTFFDTADIYGDTVERDVPRADPRGSSRPGGACDEVRHGGRARQGGRGARLRAPRGARQPRAAPDRPHRPVPAARARPDGADRRHAGRHERARARRARARDRLLELHGGAAARGGRCRRRRARRASSASRTS